MNDFEPSKDCLKDKIILITGAGSGIGRAAAKALSQFGAQLILLRKIRENLKVFMKKLFSKVPKNL